MISLRFIFKKTDFLGVLLLVFCQNVIPANLIFDMEGVLVKKSTWSACLNIGLTKFLGLYNPLTLDQKVFDFLHLIKPLEQDTPLAMHQGKRLPQIMCDWLCGAKTKQEIKTLIEEGLTKFDSFFTTQSQKALVAAICDFMFTPEKFVKAIYPVSSAHKLVKRCIKAKDKSGNKNRIFILTNWDAESFALLYNNKALKKLFSRCDGIIVSGSVHAIKPDPSIFLHLCDQFNIDPEKELTVFIDDTPCNVQTAKELGMHGILCEKLNITAVKKELKQLGII